MNWQQCKSAGLQFLLGKTLKPFLQHYYLKSPRRMKYRDLQLTVQPGVFHPGLFFSSKYFADFISALKLTNKTFLDLGTGSGLLALTAASCGAKVVATDINPRAVANAADNARMNQLPLTLMQSDLFDRLSSHFDVIVINPPYFNKNPESPAQAAWYCGEDFDYFSRLFSQLRDYTDQHSQVFMVLSDGCALDKIHDLARSQALRLELVASKSFTIEENYIFKIML